MFFANLIIISQFLCFINEIFDNPKSNVRNHYLYKLIITEKIISLINENLFKQKRSIEIQFLKVT